MSLNKILRTIKSTDFVKIYMLNYRNHDVYNEDPIYICLQQSSF